MVDYTDYNGESIHGYSQVLVVCFADTVPMLQVHVAKAFCFFTALKNFREKRWPKAGLSSYETLGELCESDNHHFQQVNHHVYEYKSSISMSISTGNFSIAILHSQMISSDFVLQLLSP